jgi:hypothetical protein
VLKPGETDYKGTWHVEGMSHERILASGTIAVIDHIIQFICAAAVLHSQCRSTSNGWLGGGGGRGNPMGKFDRYLLLSYIAAFDRGRANVSTQIRTQRW